MRYPHLWIFLVDLICLTSSDCIHDLQRAHRINSLHVICFISLSCCIIQHHKMQWLQTVTLYYFTRLSWVVVFFHMVLGIVISIPYAFGFRAWLGLALAIEGTPLFSSIRPHFLWFLGQPPYSVVAGFPAWEMEVAPFLEAQIWTWHIITSTILLLNVSHKFKGRGSKCHSLMEWGACIFRDGRNY